MELGLYSIELNHRHKHIGSLYDHEARSTDSEENFGWVTLQTIKRELISHWLL